MKEGRHETGPGSTLYKTILLALDGSPDSLAGGRLAVALSRHLGCEIACIHAYDERIHDTRFREMEPGLPERYQEPDHLEQLRASHGALMTEGFAALSRGYLEAFLGEARKAGAAVHDLVQKGRNYTVLLEKIETGAFDLAILGATGLGAQGDGLLGSTATRVLRRATCDVVVARGVPWEGRPLVVGIDGSDNGLLAARKGVTWARALGGGLELAAAYDPGLHRTVFATMGQSLSPERQAEVGLERQQELHEELIDDGLRRLYEVFLQQAVAATHRLGADPRPHLVQGKAYRALAALAIERQAGLLAVGRFGHHREAGTDVGATAEAVARLAPCSVLVVSGAPPGPAQAREAGSETGTAHALPWDPEALARLERIPSFARAMARRAVEERVRAAGGARVGVSDFAQAAEAFGMGPPERSASPGRAKGT